MKDYKKLEELLGLNQQIRTKCLRVCPNASKKRKTFVRTVAELRKKLAIEFNLPNASLDEIEKMIHMNAIRGLKSKRQLNFGGIISLNDSARNNGRDPNDDQDDNQPPIPCCS